MSIGDNIKKWREARHLKQSELAEMIGVSDKTVSSWEINRTEPKMGMVEKICEALYCKKTDIIGGDNNDIIESMSPYIFAYDEQELIDRYRALDERGKKLVNSVLEQAYISRPLEGQMAIPIGGKISVYNDGQWHIQELNEDTKVKAAHNDSTDPSEVEKMMQDLENLKRPK